MTEYLPAPEPVSPFQTSFDDGNEELPGLSLNNSRKQQRVPMEKSVPVRSHTTGHRSIRSGSPRRKQSEVRSEGRSEGQSEGQRQGHSQGRSEGQRQGQSEGLSEGRSEGQRQGQSQGRSEGQSQGHSQGQIHSQNVHTPQSLVKSWSSNNIKEWLESINCGEYFNSFQDNHINGETLLECDQTALKYLGIKKVGDRIRINQSLNNLRTQYVMSISSSHSQTRSLEDLNRNSISPFAALISPQSQSHSASPMEGYFSPKPSSTGTALGIISGSALGIPPSSATSSRFPIRRGMNNTKSPPPSLPITTTTTTTTVLSKTQPANNNVQEIFSMDVVKQNNLKFIYPQGESKTVNIAGCTSADEIKHKALQKIMADNVANPVDWIVFVAIDDKYRHLGDAELMSISQSAQSLERKRLMLCSIGTSPSTKQLEKSKQIQINSHLKLSSLTNNESNLIRDSTISRKSISSINRLSLAQSLAATSYEEDDLDDDWDDDTSTIRTATAKTTLRPRKIGKLSDHRPPSELISSNLAHFFPYAPTNDLEETIRNSKRFSKRMSRMSRISQRMSVSSSAWEIPEDDEVAPPLPTLPADTSDQNTITPDIKQRPSIRDSIRKSVLPKRYSSNDLNTGVLSALSNRFSGTITLSKSKKTSPQHDDEQHQTVTTPKIEVTQESEDEEDDEDDSTFLATVRKEESCPTKWIKGRLIGSGSFGTVYLGMNSFTGELMAVKQVEIPTEDSETGQRKKSMVDALQREMNLLRELQHENIVQYLGSNSEGNFLNIFLEYVPGGSVAMLLSNYGVFEESLIRNFVRQILQGLKYLHEQNIIHRDIKGANVLVDNKGCIKISDFGISKKIETKLLTNNRVSLQGSVFWMAPEVVKQLPYTLKADIWSLGCLIVEMFSGTHPFPEFTQMQVIFRLGNSGTPAIPEDCTDQAKDFLTKTFAIDHDKRPTAVELLDHPFLEPMSQ